MAKEHAHDTGGTAARSRGGRAAGASACRPFLAVHDGTCGTRLRLASNSPLIRCRLPGPQLPAHTASSPVSAAAAANPAASSCRTCSQVISPSRRSASVKPFSESPGSPYLVYELLNGCDLFVLVDAAQRGCEPGTVTVLEVGPGEAAPPAAVMDAHGLAPDEIFAMLGSMGSRPGRSLVVACEPADVSAGMGLSDQVRAALPQAVGAVEEILDLAALEGGKTEPYTELPESCRDIPIGPVQRLYKPLLSGRRVGHPGEPPHDPRNQPPSPEQHIVKTSGPDPARGR